MQVTITTNTDGHWWWAQILDPDGRSLRDDENTRVQIIERDAILEATDWAEDQGYEVVGDEANAQARERCD